MRNGPNTSFSQALPDAFSLVDADYLDTKLSPDKSVLRIMRRWKSF